MRAGDEEVIWRCLLCLHPLFIFFCSICLARLMMTVTYGYTPASSHLLPPLVLPSLPSLPSPPSPPLPPLPSLLSSSPLVLTLLILLSFLFSFFLPFIQTLCVKYLSTTELLDVALVCWAIRRSVLSIIEENITFR